METCEQQIFRGFEAESLCLAREYPVSQRVLPGSGEARRMTVGSGIQCSMWLEGSSQLGVFSRILLASSAWTNSEECCYVWGRLDTRFGCSAFQLTPLGLITEDSGYSLWRTPNASDVTGGAMDGQQRLEQGDQLNLLEQAATPKLWPTPTVPNGGRRNPEGTSITGRKPDGGKAQIDLREFAIHQKLWPTPRARDSKEEGLQAGLQRESLTLPTAAKLWPTPNSGNFNDGESLESWEARRQRNLEKHKNGNGMGTPLAIAARLWPTPTSRDYKDGESGNGRADILSQAVNPSHSQGSLNPRFVEQLMGFEVDHTDLKHLGMRLCRSRRTRFSKP